MYNTGYAHLDMARRKQREGRKSPVFLGAPPSKIPPSATLAQRRRNTFWFFSVIMRDHYLRTQPVAHLAHPVGTCSPGCTYSPPSALLAQSCSWEDSIHAQN